MSHLPAATMQRMQRLTGRFLTRTPNEADIEAMLRDFNDAEVMLTKVRPQTAMLCYAMLVCHAQVQSAMCCVLQERMLRTSGAAVPNLQVPAARHHHRQLHMHRTG